MASEDVIVPTKVPPTERLDKSSGDIDPHYPAHEWLWQFFSYAHLKPELREVSEPFCKLAQHIIKTLPRNPERTVALRKLLEAKDCAVRARFGE